MSIIYVTSRVKNPTVQLSFMDVIFNRTPEMKGSPMRTRTDLYVMDETSDKYPSLSEDLIRGAEYCYQSWMHKLKEFNSKYDELHNVVDKPSLFYTFWIPKGSKVPESQRKVKFYDPHDSRFRRIDAPNDELKKALYDLKAIFENDFNVLYHTSAYAYVKKRSVKDAVKRHQQNDSRWFLKLDFSNFFGSVTPQFVENMFSILYPYGYIFNRHEDFRNEFKKALSLCFLNGGLPQGTPMSPLLTNVIMIPIDSEIARGLWHMNKDFVYTRYADDLLISSKYSFHWTEVQDYLGRILNKMKAPMQLNKEKTRYGSRNGRNWNLGLMLNKDGEITVGHYKKKMFKTSIYNFLKDYQDGNYWELHDVQVFNGQMQWYLSVEKKSISEIISRYNTKFGLDTNAIIKKYMKGEI